MDELVRLTHMEGGVALITIDRPPVNALSRDTLTELESAIAAVAADATVRAVVVTGAGAKAFVAGADIAEFPTMTPATGEELSRRGSTIFTKLETMPKPVIAAVNGVCLGGGCELAMACDLRVAASGARFGQPEINLGIIPGYGGTQRLPRLVGASRAKYICMSGEHVDAQEALRIGLADLVVPEAELMDAALGLARKLAAKAPIALGLIKRAVNEGIEQPLAEGLDLESRLFGEVAGTEDMKEGAAAFLGKRKPEFKGR